MVRLSNVIVEEIAKRIGFDIVGFSKSRKLSKEIDDLKEWLGKGYNSGMTYMEKNIEKREDPSKIFPKAKSVISLGLNYYPKGDYSNDVNYGKVSRYAWGKDYHFVMWEMCEKLIAELKKRDENFHAVYYVDTGPVMDKAWAVLGGLGWLGKHTNVINRDIGSWFFIASIICNYDFEEKDPVSDLCGTCSKCIDACPTDAITDEYRLDASKCISYLTIENKEEGIDKKFDGKFENWIFGCDICQDVCPWNIKFSFETNIEEFNPIEKNSEIELEEVERLTNQEFKEKYFSSPIKRAKLKGLKRNAKFLKG